MLAAYTIKFGFKLIRPNGTLAAMLYLLDADFKLHRKI